MLNEPLFQDTFPFQDDVLALPVSDLDEAAKWYSGKFGLKEILRKDDPCPTVILERDNTQIGFAINGGDAKKDGAAILVTDIHRASDELRSKGVQPDNWGIDERDGEKCQGFFVEAPDSLRYYFYQRVVEKFEYQISWLGGSKQNISLGQVWVEDPEGLNLRVTVKRDYTFERGKYSLDLLLQRLRDDFLIIDSERSCLINTSTVVQLAQPPRPSWFVDAIVPVQPSIFEEQSYLTPDDWYYTIGVDLMIKAEDFPTNEQQFDAFVVHASEDKQDFVRPLVYRLRSLGFRIWYDEFEITLGDSIGETIDKGLAKSRFGITIISHNFLKKKWPQYELNGLRTREMAGVKVILPVWYEIGLEEVMQYSPSIADKSAAIGTKSNIEDVAKSLAQILVRGRETS